MTCLACHWNHTSLTYALACYRRAYPEPTRLQGASDDAPARVVAPPAESASGTRINSGNSIRVNVTARSTARPAGPRRGGRPRKYATAHFAAAARAAAYRRRQKLERAAANDATLSALHEAGA